MKLSKAQKKETEAALKLLEKEKLTLDEKESIYQMLNEGWFGDVTTNSAYFTGLDLAYDFALMVPTYGTIIDLCAGFGALSFAALYRDTYENQINRIICIERNKSYIEVGKKLVHTITKKYYERGEEKEHTTEVIWIHGDMFDLKMWNELIDKYGDKSKPQPFDCLISNPPFGTITKTDCSRDWLKYKGKDLDVASLEIGLQMAQYPSYILPQGSCTFQGSGRPYFEHKPNKKIDKLVKEIGQNIYMAWASIDTSIYEENFKNTKVPVECCTITRLDAEGNEI